MIRQIKHDLMARSRQRKLMQFLSLTNPTSSSSILDVGVADVEYSPYDNFLEKHYPYPQQITALSIYSLDTFRMNYPHIKAVTYNGEGFPFETGSFSVVHCNAVVEHVGERDRQLQFIREICRVGQQFFFTTPAREFPIELHTSLPFVHWLPRNGFDYLVRKMGKGWASGHYINLLTRNVLRSLLDHSGVSSYRIYTNRLGLLPFNYIVWGISRT